MYGMAQKAQNLSQPSEIFTNALAPSMVRSIPWAATIDCVGSGIFRTSATTLTMPSSWSAGTNAATSGSCSLSSAPYRDGTQPHIIMGSLRTPSEAPSAISSVASMDSSVAEAKNEQVLIIATSADSGSAASPKPEAKRRARMRSVSTSFLAHPNVMYRTL